MRELSLFAFLAIGFASGLLVGSDTASKAERQLIADACRYGGSFTLRRTGFDCRVIRK